MSELSSLFAKIKIKKEKFTEFMNAKPIRPRLDSIWTDWWNSRQMYSKTELTSDNIDYFNTNPTNQSIVDDWMEAEEAITFSDYDEKTETWHFSILLFSENYFEMIPTLAFIRSIEKYKEEDSTDFAIVYPYFWGDSLVNIYMKFQNGKTVFGQAQKTSQVNQEDLEYANNYFEKKSKELPPDFYLD